MKFQVIVLAIYFIILVPGLLEEPLHWHNILAKNFGTFQKIIGIGKLHGFWKWADGILLVDLPGIFIFEGTIMDSEFKFFIQCKIYKVQAFHLAACNWETSGIPIVVQNPE